jgi:regulator of cell morphogenesis and NO signaling
MPELTLDPEVIGTIPVGRLAAEYPGSTRVFARYDLDYCCGGGRMLKEACLRKGIDVSQVAEEILAEIAEVETPETDWLEAPLGELAQHIVRTYHDPLAEELPRLEAMMRKVVQSHGAKDPARLAELLTVYLELKREMEDHMAKEEKILFPLIARGLGGEAGTPISVMEEEHDHAGRALHRIRELTDGYTTPTGACTTWKALWHGLESLERTMHEHIHVENNILFPRALVSAAGR